MPDSFQIYYKHNVWGNPFYGFLTDFRNGRHLVRDPSTGIFHMVMASEVHRVYYTESRDGCLSWSEPVYLDNGKYPAVGLAKTNQGGTVISVAYKPLHNVSLTYTWYDLNVGSWQKANVITATNPGPPSLAIAWPGAATQEFFVAYAAGSPRTLKSFHFRYSTPASNTFDTMEAIANPAKHCLAVDGNRNLYGAWQRPDSSQVWFAPRAGKANWFSKLRGDQTADASQQPFIDCYGDSVFAVWADSLGGSYGSLTRELGLLEQAALALHEETKADP